MPYTPDQMFDLVADIERYPEFLDEYREAKILSRIGNVLKVNQVIGLPLINLSLNAEATFARPESIIVRSSQSLLGELEIKWQFALSGTGTRVDFCMALKSTSLFGRGMADYLLNKSAARTLQAFSSRAAVLYGRH